MLTVYMVYQLQDSYINFVYFHALKRNGLPYETIARIHRARVVSRVAVLCATVSPVLCFIRERLQHT